MAKQTASVSRIRSDTGAVRKKKTDTPNVAPSFPNCHRLLASLRYPELRSGEAAAKSGFKNPDPELRLLWEKLRKLKLSDEAIGDLCSAAIQFSDAHYMHDIHAFLVKGGEIPEHAAYKKRLREDRRQLSQNELKEIEAGEADRRRWSDRKANKRIGRLSRLAVKLDAALTEVVSSPTLYVKAARVLADPLLQGMRLRLQKLKEIDHPHPTQSDLHLEFRKKALDKMFKTMPPGKPRWALLSDLIYEASGKTFSISATTLRVEHAALSSVAFARKRGVVTMRATKPPRDRV
jgi:hypothetical protein